MCRAFLQLLLVSVHQSVYLPNSLTMCPPGRLSLHLLVCSARRRLVLSLTAAVAWCAWQVEQVGSDPRAELCWYFPETREQVGGPHECPAVEAPKEPSLQLRAVP
jgi:hypothetical protein